MSALSPLARALSCLHLSLGDGQVLGPQDTAALAQALPGLTRVRLAGGQSLPSGTLVNLVRGLPRLVHLHLSVLTEVDDGAEVEDVELACHVADAQGARGQRTDTLVINLDRPWHCRDARVLAAVVGGSDGGSLPDGRPCARVEVGKYCVKQW